MKRLIAAALASLVGLLTASTAFAERPAVGLHIIAGRGTFASIPASRIGVLGELRARSAPIGGSLSFEGGLTDNGLGTHRAALGFDLRTPWPVVELNGGVHVAYAMLVRTTGNDNFMRALGGDIASFAVGVHAGLAAHVPLGPTTTLVLGARGFFDLYDGAVGAMVGPQLGIVF